MFGLMAAVAGTYFERAAVTPGVWLDCSGRLCELFCGVSEGCRFSMNNLEIVALRGDQRVVAA